jgi:hypothetical protein
MLHTHMKSYRYKMGKNQYFVLKIYQSAVASAESGNVLASNAVNVKIYKGGKPAHAKKMEKNRRR